MRPEEFWRDYVGDMSAREFLGAEPPSSIVDLHSRVRRHVERLPALYGLTLRGGSWRKTCSGFGYNVDQVADGILTYLEAHCAEWETVPGTQLVAPQSSPSEITAAPPEINGESTVAPG